MDRNFERVLPRALADEGGYVNHKNDPGGPTNKGITIATMRRYISKSATVDDLKRITDAQVAKIYRKHYWDMVKGDELPAGIDYAVFDFAVNSGPTRAAKFLQSLLLVSVDGKIGPQTIAAAKRANAAHVIEAFCAKRMTFLRSLKHWPTFKNGWTARVSMVETHALEMAREKPVGTQKPSPAPTDTPAPPKSVPAPAPGGLLSFLLSFLVKAFGGRA